MKSLKSFLLLLLVIVAVPVAAQKRNITLNVSATCATGESLEGQAVELYQVDYSMAYETIYLDAEGKASIKIYSGNNRITIKRSGYKTFTKEFDATAGMTINAELTEDVQTPFSLTTSVSHDVFTGTNNVTLGWNKEPAVFSDNFDGYEPFAIQFGKWTGIDGDGIQAAPLQGEYKNRGALMYAQIINPLEVQPSWWTDYPVLRPYSGQQYVGFIRTTSGAANDDWLISPTITPGTKNYLTFMAKAGDVGKERFQVYVTEKTDNPTEEDFAKINSGNYEQVEYQQWTKFTYDLSAYAGRPIKFAIRYISAASSESTFMLMIDDVEVAQNLAASKAAARRMTAAPMRSAQNPNESFDVYLDGTKVGNTADYEYTITDLASGTHTLGVKAIYRQAESDMATTQVTVGYDNVAKYVVNITTNNGQSVDGNTISITNKANGTTYTGTITNGVVEMKSLPYGDYIIALAVKNYDEETQTVTVSGDGSLNITLKETIVNPYNITAEATADGNGLYNVALRWNQALAFTDDFEGYDDFAQNSFGQWTSIDRDGASVYPIALGSQTNIVTFPGAATTDNPTAIAPIVFNPYTTTPAMLPADAAMTPTSGNKEILFFSPQGKQADKWLISPQLEIREGYVMRMNAKSYSDVYPETFEFCISTTDAQTTSFSVISTAKQMPASQWTEYSIDLSQYAGKKVYLAVHYTSYDTFFAQLDDFYVGTADGKGETLDVGAVKNYNISLDGEEKGTSVNPEYTLSGVAAGTHKAGICAVYASGMSDLSEYEFTINTSAIGKVNLDASPIPAEYFTLDGRRINASQLGKGVYIRKTGGKAIKTIVK